MHVIFLREWLVYGFKSLPIRLFQGCLPLALFELWVLFVNDINATFPTHDFAVGGALFNGRLDFHDNSFLFR
jgi:hypothetical protein